MSAHVKALGMGPSCSSPQHGPPVLGRGRGTSRSPTAPLVGRPPTPCLLWPRLRVPVPVASLAAGASSGPLGPTTRALAHMSCVGDGAPARRAPGVSSRKGEGLPGDGAVLCVRAMVEHPAGDQPRSPKKTLAGDGCCLQGKQDPRPPGRREVSGPPAPWPTCSHADASPPLCPRPAQGLRPARAGSPWAGRDAHPLDARQNFMKALHPPIPIDPHCLVALFFLYPKLHGVLCWKRKGDIATKTVRSICTLQKAETSPGSWRIASIFSWKIFVLAPWKSGA